MNQKWMKALSDETRLRIVKILSLHEWSVNDLVHILQLGQSRISRHLGILHEADLVAVRREGLWAYYRLSSLWESHRWLSLTLQELNDPLYDQDRTRAQEWEAQKKNATRRFFDDIAKDWGKLRRKLLGDEDPLAKLLEKLPVFSRCADLGCGVGESLPLLLQHAERVIGIDNSTEMITLARQRFLNEPRVEFRYGDIEDLPLRNEETDLATVNLSLHHLPNLTSWAKEIQRVLKRNGYIAIVDFLPHQEEKLREIYHDYWMGLDPIMLISLLQQHGFKPILQENHPLKTSSLVVFTLLMKKQGEEP